MPLLRQQIYHDARWRCNRFFARAPELYTSYWLAAFREFVGKKLIICFQGPIVPDVPGYQGTCTTCSMVPQVPDVPHEPDLLHLRDPPEIGLERL